MQPARFSVVVLACAALLAPAAAAAPPQASSPSRASRVQKPATQVKGAGAGAAAGARGKGQGARGDGGQRVPASAASSPTPGQTLDRTLAAAEMALRAGELQTAESRYRTLLFDAWMLLGELHVVAGRLAPARDAFRDATTAVVEATPAFQSLALVHLQMGEPKEAVAVLTKLAARDARDAQTRRLLAQALIANGEAVDAVEALEEAHAIAPEDPELAFVLASGYLRVKKVEPAERLFARVAAARPIAETHVLIGRTYRDFGIYDRARASLEKALAMDPRVRRAHYYLGTLAVLAEGVVRLEEAIAEFRKELKLEPADPVTNLRLGMALVELRRPAEALAPLEIATRGSSPGMDAYHYLGRCLLALDRPNEAVASLRRALDASKAGPADDVRLRHVHYQLALALRRAGDERTAAIHFAEAERASARRADVDREQLARYLTDAPAAAGAEMTPAPLESPLASATAAQRADLERHARSAIARACLNLGVMHVQAQRFTRAAELFERAAQADPAFPQVQYSLGVAYFNAQQHAKAVAPLERAHAADPANADVQRMLALALLNTDQFEKAVALLANDPRRDSDPSLQYAYAVALVRSDRASEAEAVFSRLLTTHGATPELRVLIAQAHAQQGDYESAVAELQSALSLNPKVAEANATLGLILLKQGKLAEARAALRSELQAHPGDTRAALTLATVLDMEGEQQEAVRHLRSVLAARPAYADARYLLGKILLTQGVVAEAAEQLEAAARLAPEDANIHYQLAQAYRKQGRNELADESLATYQQLKEKRRAR